MFNQFDTDSFVASVEAKLLSTPQANAVLALAGKRRERYRIIRDFCGPIYDQAYSLDGKWRFLPLNEEDKKIIPKAAFIRHAAVEKDCCRVAQVLIGHEISEISIAPPTPRPEEIAPELSVPRVKPKSEIDWGNVAEVAAKGVVIGMMGIAMISFYALIGALQLADPSYCIVLADGAGTVVELLTWNLEAQHEGNSF